LILKIVGIAKIHSEKLCLNINEFLNPVQY